MKGRAGRTNSPEVRGQLTQNVLERRNDYVQARGRYCTMMEWERDDLVGTMGFLLGQCERDVQERMLWHLLLAHDDHGNRVAEALGMSADDVRHLEPLPGQLTEEDRRRLRDLGSNGDGIAPAVWGQWTGSVDDRRATAEEVLGGMMEAPDPIR